MKTLEFSAIEKPWWKFKASNRGNHNRFEILTIKTVPFFYWNSNRNQMKIHQNKKYMVENTKNQKEYENKNT